MLEPGTTFGDLTVLELAHRDIRHRKHYLFRCMCGTEKVVLGSSVSSGNTKSCGCLSKRVPRGRMPDNAAEINHLILLCRNGAKRRGLRYELTREEFERLVRKPCHYCGNPAGNKVVTKNCKAGFRYNGIDRADYLFGYESWNCVPCCGVCNRAKGVLTQRQFIRMAARIVKHQLAARPVG